MAWHAGCDKVVCLEVYRLCILSLLTKHCVYSTHTTRYQFDFKASLSNKSEQKLAKKLELACTLAMELGRYKRNHP